MRLDSFVASENKKCEHGHNLVTEQQACAGGTDPGHGGQPKGAPAGQRDNLNIRIYDKGN